MQEKRWKQTMFAFRLSEPREYESEREVLMTGLRRPPHNGRLCMTRTNVSASEGPKRRLIMGRLNRRVLLAVPVALGLSVPSVALGVETTTTGYSQTPPPPTTTQATTPTPSNGVGPSKSSKPSTATGVGTPVTISPSTAPAPKTLPFTGLDLRWVLAAGVLLLGMGLSIRVFQRRTQSR